MIHPVEHFSGNFNRCIPASHLGGPPAGDSGLRAGQPDEGVRGADTDRAEDGVVSRPLHPAAARDEGDDPVRGDQQAAVVQK